jgi:RNA polymerase sigma factor (sigma-70 family)
MRDDPTAAVLVSRVKEGDRDAWAELIDRYAPLIWAICRRYRLSPADAEDVGQNVWLRLVYELDKIRNPAALPGWLATTTARECLRAVQGPHAPVSASDAGNLPNEQAGTAELELLAERHAALREAFTHLPRRSQQLIALLSADPPVPYAEISARLGIPIGSIGPQRARALARLRDDPAVRGLLESEGLLESVGQVRGGTRPGSATGTSGPAGGGRDFRRAGGEGTGGPPGTPGGRLPPHPPGEGPDYSGGGHGPRPRYLRGQCPESVVVDKPFSVVASINVAASPGSAELELFDVPPEGQDVVLVMWAPGLHVLSDDQQTVHVPADRDSRPVRFELRADTPGPAKVSITAWIGGTHLGELHVEITAERDRAPGPHREVFAEITTQPTEGAVSLVVRYDPSQQAYRFEFRDEDNPDEVPSNLAYDPGPVVEQLIADLDSLAAGRSGYSAGQTRDYFVNAGARLWQQLVPGQLREQFWDRQHRIRQLTILADKDAVPWELLYSMDPGHDAGFLVEQFPVTRAIFGWRPGRTLRLQPARFVLPEGSLHEAAVEVEAMRQLLDPGQAPGAVISALTPLTDLIGSGTFGLLHFACHNTYEPVGGSSIRLGGVRFTPTLLEVAAIQKALQEGLTIRPRQPLLPDSPSYVQQRMDRETGLARLVVSPIVRR